MRRFLVISAVLTALTVPLAQAGTSQGDGTLSVKKGRGTLMLKLKGTVIGRVNTSGRVQIRDLKPFDGNNPQLTCQLDFSLTASGKVNATWEDAIYRDELATLGLDVVYTLTREQPPGWTGYARRIDDDLLREVAFPASDRPRVYVCGSTRFVDAAADGLVRLGYDPMWIRTERFGATG